MKKVTCYVDFDDKRPGRSDAFINLCFVFMLLSIWDKTEIVDKKSGDSRIWFVEREDPGKHRLRKYRI